jgi:hypothetical protein
MKTNIYESKIFVFEIMTKEISRDQTRRKEN